MIAGTMQAMFECARQERVLAVRSRWTQLFAITFAALAVAVAGSGYVLTGGVGLQDFARTAVSLVQLVTILVPLTALTTGVLALAPERGAAELLYSQPVPRAAILLGRVLGLFTALVAAQALGFGVAGLVIFASTGQEGLTGFLLVILGSAALTAVSLGAAALIAVGPQGRRARIIAITLILWFAAVVLYDVAALGAASLLPSGRASRLLIVSVIVNPVDAVRTGVLLGTEGAAAFGAASLAFLRFTGGTIGAGVWLGGSVLFWILLLPALAVLRLNRTDI